jgi:hypothetical protein
LVERKEETKREKEVTETTDAREAVLGIAWRVNQVYGSEAELE